MTSTLRRSLVDKFKKVFAAEVNLNCSESQVESLMQQIQDMQETIKQISGY